ncbi:MAG: cytochrome c biogenesis protein CcsA [Prevotellaceae bacterium]|jgi:cytochrome c-type biogenesis protein CcsB|nr:cytochrome c biogenesis protein CcsA [Prevotellaceae bacterium]
MERSLISSYKAAIALLAAYASGLAIATFIEKYWGTQAAKLIIYYSPVFFFLQLLLVVNFIASSIRHRLFQRKKWGFLAVHAALMVILAGALATHILSKEGTVHLREGESVGNMLMQTSKGNYHRALPFRLELKKFTLTRYPGSSSPSGFESAVVVHADSQSFEATIAMNKVLDFKGYRFFQASYDRDEKGTILSVNQDSAGRTITYAGYALLIAGFILCFFGKNSRFRQLARLLKAENFGAPSPPGKVGAALLLCLIAFSLQAQGDAVAKGDAVAEKVKAMFQKNKVDAEHAAQFGALPMQSSDGRLEPVGTFASELLRKLHHADRIGGLTPEQFLLSLMALPHVWTHVPLIHLTNKEIALRYDLTVKKCAYNELFDEHGDYKLQRELDEIYLKPPAKRSRFEKDLVKLDEQVHIFYQLISREMLAIFPKENAENHRWETSGDLLDEYAGRVFEGMQRGSWEAANQTLEAIRSYQQEKSTIAIDSQKINAELLYNRLNIFAKAKKTYLIAGGLLLVLAFISLFRQTAGLKWLMRLPAIAIFVSFSCHLLGIALRWYIGGYAPWSNSYETMIYVSLITVLAGMFFRRRSILTFALASLFGGVILFVAGLSWMDPQISPLVPVLKSPWLMIHVAVIVAAYGFFGVSFLLGATNLALIAASRGRKQAALNLRIRELSIVNEMSLWLGLALMATGTFLGAVWANESWGRYWGWDPKETWALVTVLVYAITTHLHLVKKWDNPLLFNLMSVVAFACVLMTYFGVTYFLSGMHSYS